MASEVHSSSENPDAEEPSSSLDRELLQELRKAETGGGPLMDNTLLAGGDALYDQTALAPLLGELGLDRETGSAMPPPDLLMADPSLNRETEEELQGLSLMEEAMEKIAGIEAMLGSAQSPEMRTAEGAADQAATPPAELEELSPSEYALPEEVELPQSDSPLLQADLDDLQTQTAPANDTVLAESPEPLEEPDSVGEGALSQAQLDKLLAQGVEASEEPAAPVSLQTEDEGALSQAQLDMLLAQEAEPSEEPAAIVSLEKRDEEALSRAELDKLSAQGVEESEEPPTPAPEGAAALTSGESALSQRELDALIAREFSGGGDASSSARSGDVPMSQAELDRLLAGGLGESDEVPLVSMDDASAGDAAEMGEISQSDIDALIMAAGRDLPLDKRGQDDVLAGHDADTAVGGPMDQASIDALLSGGLDNEELAPAPAARAEDTELDQAVAAAIAKGPIKSSVGAENIAAGAPPKRVDLLRQEDLDVVLKAAVEEDRQRRKAKQLALEEALAGRAQVPSLDAPSIVSSQRTARMPTGFEQYLVKNFPKVACSLFSGLLAAMFTFSALYVNQERLVTEDMLAAHVNELESALGQAREMMAREEFGGAARVLKTAIDESKPSPLRDDVRYLRLEAMYRSLDPAPKAPGHEKFQAEVDELISQTKGHPRAPEALYWKAKVYERDDWPHAAWDTYKEARAAYPNAACLDSILMDAAKLALELRDYSGAAEYAQTLVTQCPKSPLVTGARLLLGDAYRLAGRESDARGIYGQMVQEQPGTGDGAEAFLRLARIAFDKGDYAGALRELESRRKAGTTAEGNDKVFLLLAQSYRRLGRLKEAEETLNNLLNFMPASEVTPEAMVELSGVYQDRGETPAAIEVANRAVDRYPGNPQALRNQGELLGLTGNPFAAATALEAAEKAGLFDPEVLLRAAQYYRIAQVPDEAAKIYARIRQDYGASDQALTAGISDAELLYESGRLQAALDALDILVPATGGKPQQFEALRVLSAIYRDLGLKDNLADTAQQMAALSSDPEVAADAAIALLDAGRLEESRKLMASFDIGKATDATAHRLLSGMGARLAQANPREGLDMMEQAYFSYPRARTAQSELDLLHAYLAADRGADARRLVIELDAASNTEPARSKETLAGASAWGDYLYGKGDYRTAADAYEMALAAGERVADADDEINSKAGWAKFQRANALMQLSDYASAKTLFDEIAQSDSPWATEAGLLSQSAEIQQRVRGVRPALASRQR